MINIYQLIGQFVTIGIIVYIVFKLLYTLWSCWLGSILGFGVEWKGSVDNWAVVTGASEGLGYEFSRKMAQKRYSVLMISRSEEKLRKAKNKIEAEFPKANLKILPLDLSKAGNFTIFEETIEELENIDVFINNCGVSYKYPEYFLDIPLCDQVIDNLINVNVIAVTKLLRIVMPKMVVQSRGIIINLSSIAAVSPSPLLAVYSATKIYVDFLSRALSKEYKSKGIVIQSLMPGYVLTPMAAMRKSSMFVPKADKFIDSVLRTVGIEEQTQGYWAHKLLVFLQKSLGHTISDYLMMVWVKDVRKRYYNKMARQQARKAEQLSSNNKKLNTN